MRIIEIGDVKYRVNDDQETKDLIYEAIINWMEEHSASHSGEGIYQSDSCQIDSIELVSGIVDDLLEPESLEE